MEMMCPQDILQEAHTFPQEIFQENQRISQDHQMKSEDQKKTKEKLHERVIDYLQSKNCGFFCSFP